MSGSSYPSPPSSSRSPILGDTTARIIVEPITQERNLYHASTQLEAAYHRIRQARRNLLELAETSPLLDTRRHTSDFNPGYEAITLTGEQAYDLSGLDQDEPGMQRENTHSNIEVPLRRPETMPALDFQDIDHSISWDTMLSIGSLPLTPSHPPTTRLPPLSPHSPPALLHPRRLQVESQLARRRELLFNDPTTSLGRRVAAREGGSATHGLTSPWDGASARLMAAIEPDIDQTRTAARQRRTDPVRPGVQAIDTTSRASRSLDVDTARRVIRNQTLQTRATGSTPPLGPPTESRRQRLGRGSVYPSPQSSTSNHSGRLSVLSNLPVQNLVTPVSAVSRPLLFEEPSSYVPAADFTRHYRDESDAPIGGERSYVIRRTINADGEEHVHPISFDWSDEEASPWALPRGQRDDLFVDYMSPPRPLRAPSSSVRYIQRSDTIPTSQTEGSALSSGTRRRRGWARLDPDGNEIPSDEEDELERVRAELRTRAQFQPQGSLVAPVDGVDIRPRLHPLHPNTMVPREYEPGLHPDNPPSGFGYGRIADFVMSADRSGTQPHRADRDHLSGYVYGSIADLVPAERRGTQHRHLSRRSPFSANPLPTPLEDMVISYKKVRRDDRSRTITVARHASLAGR